MNFTKVTIPQQDMQARAVSRTLLQFRNKPVFQAVLAAFISEVQALVDAAIAVMQQRTPSDATGENLEVIGRIVGLIKTAFDYGNLQWFTPDTYGHPPDFSLAWVKNAPIGTIMVPDDGMYRQMIEFKVLRNFIQYGSIPEIQTAIYTAFGIHASFQAVPGAPMDWYLIVPKATPKHIKNFLSNESSNDFVDNTYMPPYPMTWKIVGIIYTEDL